MEGTRWVRLVEIMRAMTEDRAAVVTFHAEFGPEIRRIVDFEASRCRLRLAPEELEDLTFDACMALAAVSRAWRPDGGALPWVWARRRINAVVARQRRPLHLALPPGHETEDVSIDAPGDDIDLATTLLSLAERDERCALLAAALRESVGAGDAEVWLRYRVQQQSGDPAPASTVGRELGMRPPAVRQRASRTRRKLAAAVAGDPRFRQLAELALLAPPTRGEPTAA